MSVIQEVFDSVKHLPSLPKVVHELMQLLDTDSPDFKIVVDKINRDPVIAAKVLKLANSAIYGASRQIKTIDDAVVLIGFSKLVNLVVATAVTEAMTKVPSINMQYFWKHSFVAAMVAKHLVTNFNTISRTSYQPDMVYLGVLLHGIGQLVMHLFFPEAGAALEKANEAITPLERKEIENTYLGVNHCQVGEELTRRWLLPADIQKIVRHYAEPAHPDAGSLAPVAHLSVDIATALLKDWPQDKIISLAKGHMVGYLAPSESIWRKKLESYAPFVIEAEAFVA